MRFVSWLGLLSYARFGCLRYWIPYRYSNPVSNAANFQLRSHFDFFARLSTYLPP